MIDGYINISEAAEKWGISTRRVQVLCKNGRIEGAANSDGSGRFQPRLRNQEMIDL